MIVDSSALIAVFFKEIGYETFARVIATTKNLRISAATFLETSILIDKYRKPELSMQLGSLIEEVGIIVEPVAFEQARVAREAYSYYGKGSGHAANLNYGDCFCYALARVKREPLLYKGKDFNHTDLQSVV